MIAPNHKWTAWRACRGEAQMSLSVVGLPAALLAEQQVLEGLPSYGEKLVETFLYLGILLGVLLVLSRLLPRWLAAKQPQNTSRWIRVIDEHKLDATRALYLVRVGGDVFLIGSSERGLTQLNGTPLEESQFESGPEAASEEGGEGGAFTRWLQSKSVVSGGAP